MNPPGRRRRRLRLSLLTLPLILLGLAPAPAIAQASDAPDSFSAQAAGTGMLIEISAPAALPLDVVAGVGRAGVAGISERIAVDQQREIDTMRQILAAL